MSLIPRDSFFDLDRTFSDLFRGFPTVQSTEGSFFAPRVDVKEKEGSYVINAELPGVDKDKLHVTLENGTLTIEGSMEDESSEEEEGKVIRRERRYGQFSRSFHVGDGVQEGDIQASFKDGLLKLEVPKKAPQAPERRRIDVK